MATDSPPLPLRFRDHFYGEGNFVALGGKVAESVECVRELCEMISLRASFEEEYAKGLAVMLKGHALKAGTGSSRPALDALNSHTALQVAMHSQLASCLRAELEPPLQTLHTALRGLKKRMEAASARAGKLVDRETAAVGKTQREYAARWREAEKAAVAVSLSAGSSFPSAVNGSGGGGGGTTTATRDRIAERLAAARVEADRSEYEYQAAVGRHAAALTAYEDTAAAFADLVQDAEVERIEAIKLVLGRLVDIQVASTEEIRDHAVEEFAARVQEIDVDADCHAFLAKFRTGSERAARFAFVRLESSSSGPVHSSLDNLPALPNRLTKASASSSEPNLFRVGSEHSVGIAGSPWFSSADLDAAAQHSDSAESGPGTGTSSSARGSPYMASVRKQATNLLKSLPTLQLPNKRTQPKSIKLTRIPSRNGSAGANSQPDLRQFFADSDAPAVPRGVFGTSLSASSMSGNTSSGRPSGGARNTLSPVAATGASDVTEAIASPDTPLSSHRSQISVALPEAVNVASDFVTDVFGSDFSQYAPMTLPPSAFVNPAAPPRVDTPPTRPDAPAPPFKILADVGAAVPVPDGVKKAARDTVPPPTPPQPPPQRSPAPAPPPPSIPTAAGRNSHAVLTCHSGPLLLHDSVVDEWTRRWCVVDSGFLWVFESQDAGGPGGGGQKQQQQQQQQRPRTVIALERALVSVLDDDANQQKGVVVRLETREPRRVLAFKAETGEDARYENDARH
ncbi:hypothetical protein HDU87_000422 [Geranomyces variabilis]|uniref:F-BAR domain-containing protein n=1 Tax=Geranomyces variabilis TaxID=109894 RepID=A0AAD5TNM9_9FUNG|nr:hypothetical protein HDU87_000422 [Geranomyces variabilis]